MLKYELIPAQLFHEGLVSQSSFFSPPAIKEDIIELTHSKEYWAKLKSLTLSAKEERRTGFPLSAKLIEREVRIAQGTVLACEYALKFKIAFNVAGGTHHAGTDWGEGFCILNDQAIAANYLLNRNLAKKILIIDLDVHQGNGTAEIFKNTPDVFTFSMHGKNNFPFRKEVSTLDIALDDGVGDAEYHSLLNSALERIFMDFQPDFIFYLAGVDVLATDKLGKIRLSKTGCKERDRIVLSQCKLRNIPVQVSMGGGYSEKIADIVDAHCNTFRVAADLFF